MLLTDIEIVENYLKLDTSEGAVMDAFLRIKKKAVEAQPQADNKQSTPCRFEAAQLGMKDGGMLDCGYCGVKV